MRILRITGCSMAPEYQEGDYVVAWRTPVSLRRIRPGDTILLKHPEYGILIKRVTDKYSSGDFEVRGLHLDSVDSRRFGPVPYHWIEGKVLAHIRGRR